MANRYRSDDRSRRERGWREPQAEQFQPYDDERGSGQMGESWRDYDEQQSAWEADDRYAHRHGSERYGTAGYGPARYTPGRGREFSSFTGNDFGGGDFSGGAGTYGHERSTFGGERPYGRASYGGGAWGAGSYGAGSRLAANRGEWRDDDWRGSRGDERGFFERAGDAVARWFGDEDDYGRRETYRGRGPVGYTRTDDRIREDACERLTDEWGVDASKVEVTVSNAEITLDGTVPSRRQKRRAEDLVDSLSGVRHVQNNLRVDEGSSWDRNTSSEIDGSRTV